jgi:hypothetical protein
MVASPQAVVAEQEQGDRSGDSEGHQRVVDIMALLGRLSSSGSAFVVGAEIVIDGGMTL